MKFMKLGSKPDSFQSDGDTIRYVATELTPDLVVNVVGVKFYLHKFPLLSKSACLQKLVAMAIQENRDELYIEDIPGGPAAFEICAKYCYGMTVTLNAYNVVAARCAAEYLEMYDTVEKGNLIYKIDIFLNSSIFRGWKDSIIVLQTTKSLLPWSEELKVVSHCIDSIASKASIETSKVEWSYSYNRKKLASENGQDSQYNGVRKQHTVPKDWWVEDLCDLDIDLYKRVIKTIKTKGKVSSNVIGEALKAYALRRLPGFSKGMIQGGDMIKNQSLVENIVWLLPTEKGSVSCSFLLQLLKASVSLGCGETVQTELLKRIGLQLDEASVGDLLIKAPPGETTIYDVDLVQTLVKEFVMQDHCVQNDVHAENEFQDIKKHAAISDASKGMVAKLVDCYLAEASRDPNLPLCKFICIAELVSGFPRSSHDGIYRAIDMYLKEHPDISKSDRKRICRLMDCRKLSAEACAHAVQNERLPLRVVVQVLFFEQARASSPGSQTPVRALLPGLSQGSSQSTTTNTEDDWDGVPSTEELRALKGELANLRLGGADQGTTSGGGSSTNGDGPKNEAEKAAAHKVRSLLMSKRIFSKLWSRKERDGENSSSDTSESPASTNAEEVRSTPSRNRKH